MKKILSIIIILSLLFGLFSCFENPNNEVNTDPEAHSHDFKIKFNESIHYYECICKEIKEESDHAYEWTVGTEPTYSAPGVTYKECTVCGYKSGERTVIERLIHTEAPSNALIKNESNHLTEKEYNNLDDLIVFYSGNKEKINESFLIITAKNDPEAGIYVIYEDSWTSYVFSYEDEFDNIFDEDYVPEEYSNPLVTVSYSLFIEEFGTGDNWDDEKDGAYVSIGFVMRFDGITNQSVNPTFEFFEYKNEDHTTNYFIRVYDNEECIGEISYVTDLEISREWIVDYLTDNLFIIN